LRQHFQNLSAAQQRAAEFVLQNPSEALTLSVHEMAARCGVSPSTIVRLAQDIGFKGLKEMKMQLAMEVGTLLPAFEGGARLDDQGHAAAVFENTTLGLHETLEGLDHTAMNEAVAALASANKVDVYGASTSFLVGLDLVEKLKRLGIYASGYSNAYMQAISAMSLAAGDVAFAVTYSGETAEVIETLQVAGEQGATTIALTNFSDSTVVQVADIVVSTSVSRHLLPDGSMGGRIAQLYIVDLIFTKLFASDPARFAAKFHKYNQILLNKVSKAKDPTRPGQAPQWGDGAGDDEQELGIMSLLGSDK
jgi:DNA-binding MurR/RpiR family transcriptional regulator